MERCVNCGICNVPLMLGLDGKLHCADCVSLLLCEGQPAVEEKLVEEEKEGDSMCQKP